MFSQDVYTQAVKSGYLDGTTLLGGDGRLGSGWSAFTPVLLAPMRRSTRRCISLEALFVNCTGRNEKGGQDTMRGAGGHEDQHVPGVCQGVLTCQCRQLAVWVSVRALVQHDGFDAQFTLTLVVRQYASGFAVSCPRNIVAFPLYRRDYRQSEDFCPRLAST